MPEILKIKDIVSNVHVYGLEEAIEGSKFSYATDLEKLTPEVTQTVKALAASPKGAGEDQFLTGITVMFDLCFSNKAWVEFERYRFANFVSSQSTMHRITSFDLDKAYLPYVDQRMINIMKERVGEYQDTLSKCDKAIGTEEKTFYTALAKEQYLKILYSNPAGFRLTARIVTNYRELKTIYGQRKDHRLPEWRLFCKWIETLPEEEFITNNGKKLDKFPKR